MALDQTNNHNCKSFISLLPYQPSVFESARSPDFSSLPLIIEDWIKDNGGTYSGK